MVAQTVGIGAAVLVDASGTCWAVCCVVEWDAGSQWYVELGLASGFRGAASALTVCQKHGKHKHLEVGLTPAGFILGHIALKGHIVVNPVSPLFCYMEDNLHMVCQHKGQLRWLYQQDCCEAVPSSGQLGKGQGLPLSGLLSPSFVYCWLLAGVQFSFCHWWCTGVWGSEACETQWTGLPSFFPSP